MYQAELSKPTWKKSQGENEANSINQYPAICSTKVAEDEAISTGVFYIGFAHTMVEKNEHIPWTADE